MRPTYLVELDNIGVADLLEDFYFSRDAFNVLLVVDLFFLQDFDCHLKPIHNAQLDRCHPALLSAARLTYLFACQNVGALFNLAEGAFAKGFA